MPTGLPNPPRSLDRLLCLLVSRFEPSLVLHRDADGTSFGIQP